MEDMFILIPFLTMSLIIQIIPIIKMYQLLRNKFNEEPKKEINEKSSEPKEEFDLRMYMDNSEKLLSIIDSLIYNEAMTIFSKLAALGKQYEVINMDADIKKVSESVYKSLRHEVLNNNQTVYTEDALMNIIISKTMHLFIQMSSSQG